MTREEKLDKLRRDYEAGALPPNIEKAYELAVSKGLFEGPLKSREHRGTILPLRRDAQGNVRFDPLGSGITGTMLDIGRSALEGTKGVATGRLQPTDPEAIRGAADAATLFTPVSPAAGTGRAIAGAARARGAYNPPASIPTAEALAKAADKGYKASRGMGVEYDPEFTRALADGIAIRLIKEGKRKTNAPQTHEILEQIAKGRTDLGPVGAQDIDFLDIQRGALREIAKNNIGKTEGNAATSAIRAIDRFMEKPPEESVLAGPATAAGKLRAEARANTAASKRSRSIGEIGTKAGRRAAARNSGFNTDNTLRSRAASVLENPKTHYGFTAKEKALLENVARGTTGRNALRYAGNEMSGRGSIAALAGGIGASLATANPMPFAMSTAVPATGMGLKHLANQATVRALANVDRATRSRAPLARQLMAQARNAPPPSTAGPATIISPEARTAVVRALLAAERGAQGQPPTITMDEYRAYLRGGGA